MLHQQEKMHSTTTTSVTHTIFDQRKVTNDVSSPRREQLGVFMAEEERPRVVRDSGSALGSLSEAINGDGDEIASVLIADLEEGESW